MFLAFTFAVIVSVVVADQLRGVSVKDLFVQDVVFSILSTIYKGVDESNRAGNNHYRLFLLWDDAKSIQSDCNYCHYGIKDLTDSTDDVRKYDYASEGFIFPLPTNTNVPAFELNKDQILVSVTKQLVDLFSGVDVFLNNDSCCHIFEVNWSNGLGNF